MMRCVHILSLAALVAAAPMFSVAQTFSTDKPSPLKLKKTTQDRVTHFIGTVQLSGEFSIHWDLINGKRRYLRVIFLPDAKSMAVLPHPVGEEPVKEIIFPQAEKAASILVDPETAQRILAEELLSATGEATVTVGSYRTVIDCDHRGYLAELISVSKSVQAMASTQERHFGC
jgi:hypothetical protein